MPTRRTSPRRSATRPGVPGERPAPRQLDDDFDEPGSGLAGAAPWLALLAVVLAAGALGFVVFGRSGGDMTACRTAAWNAVPSNDDLPDGWTLSSTDLSANGMTVSILGAAQPDDTANPPVVYASVTCYGDAAEAALDENQKAAKAAGSTVSLRRSNGDAYDVDNEATGSRTTLFRVGGLIGQIADGGTANATDLATITEAVAIAMGDPDAAGDAAPAPTDDADASLDPLGSDAPEPSQSPFAPELLAMLPSTIGGTQLTFDSRPASEYFQGGDPTGRAVAASLRKLGKTPADLQIVQGYDETQTIPDTIVAFRLPGTAVDALRSIVLQTWLGAGNEGVTRTAVTIGGKAFTKIDYGDAKSNEYVYTGTDFVVVVDTSDETIVAEVAATLK